MCINFQAILLNLCRIFELNKFYKCLLSYGVHKLPVSHGNGSFLLKLKLKHEEKQWGLISCSAEKNKSDRYSYVSLLKTTETMHLKSESLGSTSRKTSEHITIIYNLKLCLCSKIFYAFLKGV